MKFFYGVFYKTEDSEFNFLAAFENETSAREYKSRSVWDHLELFISKQPIYSNCCSECGGLNDHDKNCSEAPAEFSNYQE